MAFAPISTTAIIAAALAAFVFGALWYTALSRPWMAALGMAPPAQRVVPVVPMIVSIIAELIMAFVLAGVIGHLGPGAVTLKNGLISGAFVWAGFIATTLAMNYAYQSRSLKLYAIDAAHWLGVMLLQGAVLGAVG